jgi:hypothetical protein
MYDVALVSSCFIRELVSNYLGLFLNAICMGFREVSDGEWGVVRPLLPPMFRVGRLGLMIGWS